jgi:hypothetical protein
VNTPKPDPDDPLIAALQRDAARLREPPFDVELHHATMRRIRALEERGLAGWKPVLAWATGLAMLAASAGVWLPRDRQPAAPTAPDFAAVLAAAREATAAVEANRSSPLPEWMSPTASLLDPMRFSTPNPKHPL